LAFRHGHPIDNRVMHIIKILINRFSFTKGKYKINNWKDKIKVLIFIEGSHKITLYREKPNCKSTTKISEAIFYKALKHRKLSKIDLFNLPPKQHFDF
jgi:hypothetical protein